ncbi:MAG: flagellar biosynthetic protein FliO [Candidatus Calescibacterium sp.]|nr:flagellar biosynthetic protein FliO [Candidatus Calescibacterium sp.]MDW8132277.1 flagellar biosynthetic protein FliO [Candidatus Calescibacterium sp.]
MELFQLGVIFLFYALVIGAVGYFLLKFVNRIQYPNTMKISQIIDRIYLAPNKGIIFVKVANKVYMIGVADNNIVLLKEFEYSEFSKKD